MNIHPFRPAMPSRRWLLALAWAGLAALAGGCATQPGGDIPPELQTASDESDARKRARTRLALAAGAPLLDGVRGMGLLVVEASARGRQGAAHPDGAA